MDKYLLAAIIALSLMAGCKEDQQGSGGGAQPKIYHTEQPRADVPEEPTWILLAAGGVMILTYRLRFR
jgi:hypothetical protein